uniref:Uncharacterized protein n=1 Tax=Xiphophorus couchianus TaxID=32473 RepID=A0A3B5ME73_9TELE
TPVLLCLVCLVGGFGAVLAGPIRKTGSMEGKAAPQEEVNVLTFGVIQLSESLNYVFETTEAKMERISKTLKSREETLQQLGQQTEQAAEVEQQIKVVVQLLQVGAGINAHLQILKGLQTWNKIQKKDIETQDEQLSKLQKMVTCWFNTFHMQNLLYLFISIKNVVCFCVSFRVKLCHSSFKTHQFIE